MTDWEIIKDAPVICFCCDDCEVRGHYLYCNKEKRTVYVASKPKWCPKPLWRNKVTGETHD